MKPEETNDSTREGEEKTQAEETKIEHYDPQAELREAIADKRRQELRDEGVDIPEDDKSEDDESEEDEVPEDEDGTDDPEGEVDEDDDQSDEDMVGIKVDGKVEKVKQSVVDAAGGIRALQKERAADKRLQEAARRDKELAERERVLEAREKGLKDPVEEEPGGDGKATPPASLDRKQLVELVNKLQYGDADEAAEAMETILAAQGQSQGSTPVDTRQIAAQVRADIKGEDVLRKFSALPENGGFGDLQDTRFAKIPTTLGGKVYHLPAPLAVARQEVDRMIAEDGADPFAWETYEKAGTFAREQFGLQAKGNPTRSQRSKQERKRATDHPRGSTPQKPKKTDVEKSIDQQRRSAVAEMMESRAGGAA